jgi:hypothetical protein
VSEQPRNPFAHLPVRPKVHIATPTYDGKIVYPLELAMVHIIGVLHNLGVESTRTVLEGTSIITVARNKMTDMFLTESTDTHLLFVDSDIVVNPKDVVAMLASGHPIVGLPCSRKSIMWDRLIDAAAAKPEHYKEHPDELMAQGCTPNWQWMPGTTVQVERGFAPVEHVGTGCMLIAREVFDRMAETAPIVRLHKNMQSDKEVRVYWDNEIDHERKLYVGEDVAFCKKARALGYQPHILVSAQTRHVGTFEYRCNVLADLTVKTEMGAP